MKGSSIPWTPELHSSFELTKHTLCKNFPLHPINEKIPIVIHCDVSQTGIGAMMLTGSPTNLQVAAFFSKSLTPTQQAYDASSRELLGLQEATKNWQPILASVAHSNTRLLFVTDHLNLIFWSVYIARLDFCLLLTI
jgi:hypothetical protein